MTPNDYIASIKAKEPREQVIESSLPDGVKAQLVKNGQDISELISLVNQSDWAQSLLEHMKTRLHHSLASLVDSDYIAIGTIGNQTPDIYVKKLPSGYAIVFHSGMKNFIYRIARVIATRFHLMGAESAPSFGNDLKETARLIAEVFWWFKETGHAFGPQYPIDESQIQIASVLAMEAEVFLIAHEIGHIISDGLQNEEKQFLDLPGEISSHHLDEFTADFLGVQMVMELHNEGTKRDGFNAQFQYATVEFALQIYRVMEELGFEFQDSHPSAGERIARIRIEMKRRCKDDTIWGSLSELAYAIDGIFTQIIQIINEPDEHAEFFDREAEKVVSELDQALEKYIGEDVPNYIEFYSAASEIFNRGYSHIMLKRIAQVAAEFFADFDSAKDGSAKPNHDKWVRFKKFKLLFGYIKELNEPAKSLFTRYLGAE